MTHGRRRSLSGKAGSEDPGARPLTTCLVSREEFTSVPIPVDLRGRAIRGSSQESPLSLTYVKWL
jgi:hypothetical protein